jgi:uncharacterized Tic20 family protein
MNEPREGDHFHDQPPRPTGGSGLTPRNLAMLCHLSGLLLYFGIPFGNIVAPLAIWLLKKDEMPEVDHAGKEALNFQITILLGMLISGLMIIVIIGIILLPALMLFNVAMVIIASVKTSEGEDYRYPISIRFIR